MKGIGNAPLSSLGIPREQYLRRVAAVSIHEAGHLAVKSPHLKQAAWVSTKNGVTLPLGEHCDDNQCVMYEIVNVNAPP